MRLSSEFIRLPLNVDVQQLLREANQFSEYDWGYHPLGYHGNTALSLVSSGGDSSNSTSGAMLPTANLDRAPYIQQVMHSLGTVIGRSRLMRLAPNSLVPAHSDTDYAWRKRVRIHIPIITDPRIIFSSIGINGEPDVNVHMAAGEAWIFDNWREHTVVNPTDVRRIHLVIDTHGTPEFWAMVNTGWSPKNDDGDFLSRIRAIEFEPAFDPKISFDETPRQAVSSADEIDSMIGEFMLEISHLQTKSPSRYHEILAACTEFCQHWRAHGLLYPNRLENIPQYQPLSGRLKASLKPKLLNVALQSNRAPAFSVIANWLDYTTDNNAFLSEQKAALNRSGLKHDAPKHAYDVSPIGKLHSMKAPRYHAPVFIVSAPRAGSTLLFETLKTNKLFWTFGDEVSNDIESIAALNPKAKSYESNALEAKDATPAVIDELLTRLASKLRNSSGISFNELSSTLPSADVRLIEKTLKNALRIPFLKKVFPEAKFILMYRDAKANIASLIDAWDSGRFVNYSDLPGQQPSQPWSMPLTHGWQEALTKPTAETAVRQWSRIVEKMRLDLEPLKNDTLALSYESLLADPSASLRRVCQFCDVPFGPKMQHFEASGFPHSKFVLSEPADTKWLRHESALRDYHAHYQGASDRLDYFVDSL